MCEILIIDRFEGNIAVCESENGGMVELDSAVLPGGIREGSVLRKAENGTYVIDAALEAERRKKIRALEDSLWE